MSRIYPPCLILCVQGPTEGGGAWDDARSGVEYTVNVKVANRRNTSVGARRDRRWSLNERQTPHVRGVRVALGTGYHPGEGNRRASRNSRELIPTRIPNVPIRNFCIAVWSREREWTRWTHTGGGKTPAFKPTPNATGGAITICITYRLNAKQCFSRLGGLTRPPKLSWSGDSMKPTIDTDRSAYRPMTIRLWSTT
jgi:hypothetical protein